MTTFVEGEGPLRLYQMPETDGVYVIGGDVAEGLDHGDYSCAHVLDVRTGNQCAVWHGHIPADEFGHELYQLGRWYNNALIGCESNNHGLTTITVLRQLNYARLYRDRKVDDITKKVEMRYGFRTDRKTKPLILDELAAACKSHDLTIYDKPTIGELKTFVRDEMAKLHGSPHDDRVMALAIAWKMMEHAHAHDPVNPVDDRGTFNWWMRQAQKAEEREMVPIGHFNRRQR
jgi:hypothetical protein